MNNSVLVEELIFWPLPLIIDSHQKVMPFLVTINFGNDLSVYSILAPFYPLPLLSTLISLTFLSHCSPSWASSLLDDSLPNHIVGYNFTYSHMFFSIQNSEDFFHQLHPQCCIEENQKILCPLVLSI